MSAKRAKRIVLYHCGCCESWHPWEWDGDCRDDTNRYGAPEDYAERHGIDVDSIITVDEENA